MKETLSIIGIFIFVLFLAFIVSIGFDKSEIAECKKIEGYSKEYARYNTENGSGFYLTKWQNEQCIAHGIIIDAHVR